MIVMDVVKLSSQRYSVRGYQPRPVPQEMLDTILEAGRLAPSAVNKQPWKFIVVKSDAARERLCECYDREWFKTAPAFIVVCGDHSQSWKRPADGKDHCDIDAAIATEHMALAAASLGLGSCWVCNFSADSCKKMLGLPEAWEPIVILPIGFPETENVPAKNRKATNEIVAYL